MSERRSYPAHQSPLFKLKSPAQLADILFLTLNGIEAIRESEENYIRFNERKSGRPIQWPKPRLRVIQKRIATLLSRIETPDYLHSAIKGRSYVTNARQHTAAESTVKVDIRRFFPSVRAAAVFHFFRDTMQCAPDVAAILTRLLTVDGHLPTGSSASPILSYFTYGDMFAEIEQLVGQRGGRMTCYIDDMTFTGPGATRRLIYDVRRIARRYRLWAHKTKVFKPGQPRVITGVALTRQGARLPNRRQKAISEDLAAMNASAIDTGKLVIAKRLVSRMFEAAQVDSRWRERAEAMVAIRRGLERRVLVARGSE